MRAVGSLPMDSVNLLVRYSVRVSNVSIWQVPAASSLSLDGELSLIQSFVACAMEMNLA